MREASADAEMRSRRSAPEQLRAAVARCSCCTRDCLHHHLLLLLPYLHFGCMATRDSMKRSLTPLRMFLFPLLLSLFRSPALFPQRVDAREAGGRPRKREEAQDPGRKRSVAHSRQQSKHVYSLTCTLLSC